MLSKFLDPAHNEETQSLSSGPTSCEDSEATHRRSRTALWLWTDFIQYYLKKFVLSSLILSTPPHLLSRKGKAGIKWCKLGVAFENLHVIGLCALASYQSTLSSLLNPLNHLLAIQHPLLRDIISGFLDPQDLVIVPPLKHLPINKKNSTQPKAICITTC